jgi:hypothetical protein
MYDGTYEVTLRIPDCRWSPEETGEPNDPIGAVRSFIAQASQTDLWVYTVQEEDHPRRTFLVDMADGSVVTP